MTTEVDFYLQRFGIQDSVVSRITHDAAMVAAVYKIEQLHSDPLILKICDLPRHYYREHTALERLAGIIPVPRLKGSIPPDDQIRGAILMEYIPGTILSGQMMTEDMAYELGAFLARVHLMRGDGSHEDAVRYFVQKFEENIAECKEHLSENLLHACRTYLATQVDLLRAADGPCMVHGDFHPGNIIVGDNTIKGVIDWSSMHYGFAEDDVSRLEYSGWNLSIEVHNAFLQGYCTIRPVPDYHKVLPLFRLSKRLAIIGFIVRTGTWNTHHANVYHEVRQRLENFLSDL